MSKQRLVGVLWGLTGVLALGCSGGSNDQTAEPATATVAASATTMPRATPTAVPLAGDPQRIRIPKLALDAALEALGPDATNSLREPSDPARLVGWYPDYGRPGSPGNTYMSAFNFYKDAEAPFRRLAELQPGDVVELTGVTGSASYRVTTKTRYDAATLPFGDILFAPARPASAEWLTLMTAGGELGPDGDYLQNDVVVAERVR